MKAFNIKTEYLKNPLGIDIENPRVMWNCEGGVTQTAYQIVTDDWDSGKIESSSMRIVVPVKFEKDCPMVSLLSKAYEQITQLDGTPVTTTGGTYAKLMPHIVPFGPSFPGQKGIGHQPNEWMKIEDLNTNAKIYALGIYYLGML